jgi:hypothetical protein
MMSRYQHAVHDASASLPNDVSASHFRTILRIIRDLRCDLPFTHILLRPQLDDRMAVLLENLENPRRRITSARPIINNRNYSCSTPNNNRRFMRNFRCLN